MSNQESDSSRDASRPMPSTEVSGGFDAMRALSPRRKSTAARSLDELVDEQLAHFGLDPGTSFGQTLARLSRRMYESYGDLDLPF